MKLTYILILIFFTSFSNNILSFNKVQVDTSTLNFIRTQFYLSIENEEETEKLIEFIYKKFSRDFSKYEPIILAYYGSLEALKGKHAFNPFNKLSYLNSSMEKIGESIKQEPYNLEIRFLRFSILHHLPSILGYSKERKEDMIIIYDLLLLKDYSILGKEIQKGIVEFMIESERLSKKQVNELKKISSTLALND